MHTRVSLTNKRPMVRQEALVFIMCVCFTWIFNLNQLHIIKVKCIHGPLAVVSLFSVNRYTLSRPLITFNTVDILCLPMFFKPFCLIQLNHKSQLKQQIFIRNKHIFTKTDIIYYKHMPGPRYDVIKLSARSYRVISCDADYDVHMFKGT